jgi:hypothetical protein
MATNTYQLIINYNAGGQFAANVLHYTFDDAGFTSTSLAAKGLTDGFDAANRTALRNILSSHVTLLTYRARCITSPGGFEGGTSLPAGTVGVRAGNLMVAGAGPVIIFYPTGNRKERGRIFIPGISDTDCVDGIITSAFHTVLTSSASTLISPFNAVGGGAPVCQPVVRSRKLLQSFNIGQAQISIIVGQVRRRQVPV